MKVIFFLIIFCIILILQTIMDFCVCKSMRKNFPDFYAQHGRPGPLDRDLDRVMHKFRLSFCSGKCKESRKIVAMINVVLALKFLIVFWIAASLAFL